jgi:hypothetical protein
MTIFIKVNRNGEVITQMEGIEIESERLGVVDPDDNCTWLSAEYFKDAQTEWWNGTSWQTRALATLPYCSWQDGAWVQSPNHVAIAKGAVQKKLRSARTQLLWDSDWTQMLDSPLTDAKKLEWSTYRQELRDLPATEADRTDMADFEMPTKPT